MNAILTRPVHIAVVVSDGAQLSVLRYPARNGPAPAVVILTPYRKEAAWFNNHHVAIERGPVPRRAPAGSEPVGRSDDRWVHQHGHASVGGILERGLGATSGDAAFLGSVGVRLVVTTRSLSRLRRPRAPVAGTRRRYRPAVDRGAATSVAPSSRFRIESSHWQ
jgi:hypothetical protein